MARKKETFSKNHASNILYRTILFRFLSTSMYLILSPSDIYFMTGVHPHDPGEIMILLGAEKSIVFCDARTSGLFDAGQFAIIDSREQWADTLRMYPLLETDPSCLTIALKEKLEKYGTKFTMVPSPITEQRIIKTTEEVGKL